MKHTVSSELFDRKETAQYFRICRSTLDSLPIPRIQIRRRVFYRKPDVDKWLEQKVQIKGGQK